MLGQIYPFVQKNPKKSGFAFDHFPGNSMLVAEYFKELRVSPKNPELDISDVSVIRIKCFAIASPPVEFRYALLFSVLHVRCNAVYQ